jgi:hypothetical protein
MNRYDYEVEGGWVEIRGERRFKPLAPVRLKHCISCAFFRKGHGGYCVKNPNIIVSGETEACEGFLDRNADRWEDE